MASNSTGIIDVLPPYVSSDHMKESDEEGGGIDEKAKLLQGVDRSILCISHD